MNTRYINKYISIQIHIHIQIQTQRMPHIPYRVSASVSALIPPSHLTLALHSDPITSVRYCSTIQQDTARYSTIPQHIGLILQSLALHRLQRSLDIMHMMMMMMMMMLLLLLMM